MQETVGEKHDEFKKFFLNKSSTENDQKEDEAKAKIVGFDRLKGSLYEKLMIVHEKLEEVDQQIRASVRSKQNQDGLLTQPLQAYIACLDLKIQDFEDLL